ncbi:cell death-inducing p53-target protein 1 homolog isoform X1 [Xiphophorus couchianus]|uniref:cell death-inducing p53-target protein 1 homolog isoform X1 n=1 Tax=Xiphophorus couchianus TaxID=32473 RepID=UPI001015DD68|nr:cell death-inducing p53-target protein 1 homolog isoform X1 [Xiphophorus couchianus]XP_027873534.1 cell death-inducing p53-target protein 1 homolog isoform X1 [Xiphophorus couchianus]XP_027873535.1 cell death-inducing p53-target protein 1 homolog isoform X1 [Xiphophorus couchianus]
MKKGNGPPPDTEGTSEIPDIPAPPYPGPPLDPSVLTSQPNPVGHPAAQNNAQYDNQPVSKFVHQEHSQDVNQKNPQPVDQESAQPVPQQYPEPGAQQYPQPGAQQYPQPGVQQYPQPGAQQYPQPGAQQYPQPGVQQYPQPEAQQYPQPGAQQYPQPGVQQYPQPGAQQYPQPGVQQYPQPGAQQYPQPGIQQYPQPAQQPVVQNIATIQQNQPLHSGNQVFLVQHLPTDVAGSMLCPHCKNTVVTSVEYKVGMLTWIIFGVLFLFFCWPCSFIPFCVNSCKDVQHSCPQCNNVLHLYKRR